MAVRYTLMMARQKYNDGFLLLDFSLVMMVVVFCSSLSFNYYYKSPLNSVEKSVTYLQTLAMSQLQRECLGELCFNGNGNINHAQTIENCVYQLGFGRYYCE